MVFAPGAREASVIAADGGDGMQQGGRVEVPTVETLWRGVCVCGERTSRAVPVIIRSAFSLSSAGLERGGGREPGGGVEGWLKEG